MVRAQNLNVLRWAPVLVLLSVWGAQAGYRMLFSSESFSELSDATVEVALYAVMSFVYGAVFAQFVPIRWSRAASPATLGNSPRWAAQFELKGAYRLARAAIIAAGAFYIVWRLVLPVLSGADLFAARNEELEAWAEGSVQLRMLALAANVLASLIVLMIALEYRQTRRLNYLLGSLFVLICTAAFARTLILIGTVIVTMQVVRCRPGFVGVVLKALLGFLGIFALLALFTKFGGGAPADAIEQLLHHLEVYLFGGLAGFNEFVTRSAPACNCFLTLPRFLHSVLFPMYAPPPAYHEFVETPTALNIYTALYPPMHDGGTPGVMLAMGLYGFVSSFCCRKFALSGSFFWLTAAGFSVYATAMSVFDDQFVRAAPVLMIFLATAVGFSLVLPLFVRPRSERETVR